MRKWKINFNKKNMAIFGLVVIILLVILFLVGNTYGYYQANLELKDSLEMTVATLSYGLNDEYKVIVPANDEVRVPFAVMGLNSEETKYQMYYRSSDDLTKVIVGYASYSSNLPRGDLAVGESKQVSLILQNNGDSEVTAFVGVKGGYQNNSVEDILLGNGEIRITNRIESEEVTEDMATPEDILSGKKAWVDGNKIMGNIPNQGELNWKPSDGTTYTVPAGYYSGGTLDSQDAYNNGYEDGYQDSSSSAKWQILAQYLALIQSTSQIKLTPGMLNDNLASNEGSLITIKKAGTYRISLTGTTFINQRILTISFYVNSSVVKTYTSAEWASSGTRGQYTDITLKTGDTLEVRASINSVQDGGGLINAIIFLTE